MDHYKNKEPPVPVPNLIKKSRGRRVPTEAETDELSGGPSSKTRMFRCDVLGCGKCFLRGEHLKRHIRSIHTHEKRSSGSIVLPCSSAPNLIIAYKCVVPSCGKHFSRRDNLVQHLKIHKDLDVSALTSALPPSPPFSFQDFDYDRKSVSPVATSDDSSYSASPSPPHQHQTSVTGVGLPVSESQYPPNDTFDRFLMTNITMAVSPLQQDTASSTGVDYFYDTYVGAAPQYVQQEQSFNQHSAYSLSPPVSSLPQNQMPVHYFYQ